MATTTGHILMGPSKDGSFGFSIEWKIDGFRDTSGRLHSPRISLGGIPGEWNMWLDKVLECDHNAFALTIYLRYSPPPKGTLKVSGSPEGRIDVSGSQQFVSLGCKSFQKASSENVWTYSKIAYEECLETGKFCNLSISVDGKLQETSPPTSRLSPDDLEKLYGLGGATDVTLKGNDEWSFSAHLLMLSIKSPVFAAMFEQDIVLEKNTTEVTIRIPDFNSDLLRGMFYHMYTGKEPRQLGQMASSLLQAADKYDLQDLKEMCEVHLARQLDMSNFQETLDQSITFNCCYLKSKCMEWASEYFPEYKKSEFWDEAVAVNHAGVLLEAVTSIS